MFLAKGYYLLLCSLLAGILLCVWTGCTREYSYEGSAAPVAPTPAIDSLDSAEKQDSLKLQLRPCPGCTSTITQGLWSVNLGGTIQCGIIDTGILNLERNAFTFFGPSKCSQDTGLIISAWLEPEVLNRNREQLTTQKVSFYYYDNKVGPYMLQSQQGTNFSLTILKYDHATKLAEGVFSGNAFLRDGRIYAVREGRWKTYLK